RKNVVPPLANYILSFDSVKKFIFPLVSQIGINYRQGSLSRHEGDEDFKVKAGDRMPYFLFDGQSIYDRLREPRFHLLVFSQAEGDYQEFRGELESAYPEEVDFHHVSLDASHSEAFGSDKSFCVLLRPDNYIAYISIDTSMGALESYLNSLAARE
ncbi:MAG: pentachlorophenol monooxygenase, partial [Acidobacteria bacterium]|nr:pentachlorophenol monooxygenase [Acidobacteriota bacterium]